MYIRQTSTSRGLSKAQYTYRLVETERVNGKVKQRIVLNLGRHFDVSKSEWKALAGRISQIINTQNSLFDIKLSVTLESMAQNIAARIIASHSSKDTELPKSTFHSIDPDSMVLVRPRRVGVETLPCMPFHSLDLLISSRSWDSTNTSWVHHWAISLPEWHFLLVNELAITGCSSAADLGN